jgi:hypothetical protein
MNKLSLLKVCGICIALAVGITSISRPAQANIVVKSKLTPATSSLTTWYEQTIPSSFRSPANITLYAYNNHEMDNYLRSVGLFDGTSYASGGPGEIEGLFDNRHLRISVRISEQGTFDNQVLTHEYGHYVWFKLLDKNDRNQYRLIYNTQRRNHHLISDYADTNLEEGFAEAFAFFITSPNSLQQKDQLSYGFLSDWQTRHNIASQIADPASTCEAK